MVGFKCHDILCYSIYNDEKLPQYHHHIFHSYAPYLFAGMKGDLFLNKVNHLADIDVSAR